ncbi:MAG: EAL domain-containing protein [Alphaproteobacteria bacterium]|nr:EAL domain-containing protein [Alphaproteobacteria bacterium]NCQ87649.1 EAL domain-containing protein [Alphaproteobacteria bacterium]NCT05842.1 EAL domain-containing protein [Alphaproteobacteria bacterium]
MSEIQTMRDLRDRFVAFSFAASDFLIELDPNHNIVFSAGQTRSLIGAPDKSLVGKSCFSLFSNESAEALKAFLRSGQKSGRIGPLMVDLVHIETKAFQKALLMGMYIPENPHIFLTFNATPSFHDFLAAGAYQDVNLLDEKEFEMSAIKAFDEAKREGKTLDVTFLESDHIEKVKANLSPDQAEKFDHKFKMLLKEQSYKGNAASQMNDNKYALIHDTAITGDYIEQKIQQLIKESKPSAGRVDIKTKTAHADMGALNEREARRALLYTMKQFEEMGLDATSTDLSKSFDQYLQENADKITRLKTLVGQQAFKIQFQPIVFLPSEEICHFEALVRFTTNDSPYELIVFGEDIGIAPDIDMAIIKQAIGYISRHKDKTPGLRIAVNISGQSIQSESFFKKLTGIIKETGVSPKNLMFEITESTSIGDLVKVNGFIQVLRKQGFEVCLDDFGAGAASFQYLNGLEIDCVKIDGKYVRDAENSIKDEAMVRNLVRMCKDLGITTIAEMVETEKQMNYLTQIGVDKGQGWLYGKPVDKAEYTKRDA